MKNLSKEELLSRIEAINRSNALIYFDLYGVILGVNDIFLETMGYKANEKNQVIGKHHSIFISYDYSKSDEYLKFWQDLKAGKIFNGIFERKKVDGSAVYLQASYNPIFDSKGNVTSIIKIAIDVTEAIENKKAIKEREKELGKKVGDFSMSHHSTSLVGDPDLKELQEYIGSTSWNVLDHMGYNLTNYELFWTEFWVQEFGEKGGGHHEGHIHYDNHIIILYY